MKEALAVSGYIPNKTLELIQSKSCDHPFVDVMPEHSVESVFARVSLEDVDDVRIGAEEGGKTFVQLILREAAAVETVEKTFASLKGLGRLQDPLLMKARAQAVANVIMI